MAVSIPQNTVVVEAMYTFSSLKLVAVFRPLGFFVLTATQTQTEHATDSCIPQTEQHEPRVVLRWKNAT